MIQIKSTFSVQNALCRIMCCVFLAVVFLAKREQIGVNDIHTS